MTDLHYFAAAVLATVSAARITRLITWDSFPPMIAIRNLWNRLTENSGWNILFHCPWCMSFWVTLGVLGAGWGSDWHPIWWFVNAAFALSYLAAMIVVRDGDDA